MACGPTSISCLRNSDQIFPSRLHENAKSPASAGAISGRAPSPIQSRQPSRALLVSLLFFAPWMTCTPSAATLDDSLIGAVAKGRTSEVQELLAHGANPDAKAEDGTPALIIAAYGGHTQAMQALLDKGANL